MGVQLLSPGNIWELMGTMTMSWLGPKKPTMKRFFFSVFDGCFNWKIWKKISGKTWETLQNLGLGTKARESVGERGELWPSNDHSLRSKKENPSKWQSLWPQQIPSMNVGHWSCNSQPLGCVWKCWLNPEKPNGFHDHYPYWMAIIGNINPTFSDKPTWTTTCTIARRLHKGYKLERVGTSSSPAVLSGASWIENVDVMWKNSSNQDKDR